MGDILDEASSVIECKECPWYKSCVAPMRFATEDLIREMRQMAPGAGFDQTRDQEFRNLVMNMAAIAQSVLLEGCPIFVRRLKSSPRLAEQLKNLMQNWGSEE
ncbi:MAG: hypothetical protein DRI39_01130 [Chloroflexi bacterium]|nr:MAG: hypothetical protein DRI40_09460 [Chloroflexota bacterium]RLC95047.1 MAG: hypothetical protein DRI39_01130 [Chloroflexota bacterium]